MLATEPPVQLNAADAVVPGYVLHATGGRELPFIISLLMHDAERRPVLPPAVARSIDRIVDITGRVGVLTRSVLDSDAAFQTIRRTIPKALAFNNAILLFRCQSAGAAECLMTEIMKDYRVTLVKGTRCC